MNRIPDFSYLNPLVECEQKWYYKFIEEWDPKEESVLLKAGRAGHGALAEWYHPRSMYSRECALDALHVLYEGTVPRGKYEYLTFGHLETIVKNYHDYWLGKCPWDVVQRIEDPIIAKIDGVEFGGIPDLMVEEHGELLVVDHKFTTSYLGGHLYNRVKFQHQLRKYCLLASEEYDTPVRAGAINAIYMGDKASNSDSKAMRFDRYRFDFTEEQLEETEIWLLELNRRATEHRRYTVTDDDEFPQHGGSHCGWCEYRPLCEASPPLRDGIKNASFKKREVTGLLRSGADS